MNTLTIANRIELYWAQFRIALTDQLYYPMRVYAAAVAVGIRLFFVCVIYTSVYKTLGTPNPEVTLAMALASMTMYQFLLTIQFRLLFDTITGHIRTGSFEIELIRPYSYLFNVSTMRFGSVVPRALAVGILGMIFVYFFAGSLPDITWSALWWGVLTSMAGAAVSAGLYILIALPALWINDADPMYYIVDKAILVLGGAYIPIVLMPVWVQSIVLYTPFGATMLATQMFNSGFVERAPLFLLVQCVWAGILLVLVRYVYKRAQRSISINGG